MLDEQVTIGELYRLCQRIEGAVNRTNGRVTALETDVAVLQDRSEQARDGHARYVGWGGMVTGIGGLIWQLFHKP